MLSRLRSTPRALTMLSDLNANQRVINKFSQIGICFNNSSAWTKNFTSESGEVVGKPDHNEISIKSEDTFASLLRHSAFMQIGNPIGKVSSVML